MPKGYVEQLVQLRAAATGGGDVRAAQTSGLDDLLTATSARPQPLRCDQVDIGHRYRVHTILFVVGVGGVELAGDLLDVQYVHIPIAVHVGAQAAGLDRVEGEQVVVS